MARTLTQLLGEANGSVLVADLVGFSGVAAGADPTELGLWLTSFYLHVAEAIEAAGGRVVKFLGDGVLAAFFAPDHAHRAIAAARALAAGRAAWHRTNARARMPQLDYAVGVASGRMLEGEIGTDRTVFYDVIGAPVVLAFRVCALAERRAEAEGRELIDESTALAAAGDARVTEVGGAELEGGPRRLFRPDPADGGAPETSG